MTLVDMPGWESGITQHSLAIDNYLDRSAACCVVVSVDEGVLKESLRKVIEELAIHDKPMMLVITKCDKKRPEDVEAVVSHVQAQIEKLAKKPLLAVCRTQRRNATEWATALWFFCCFTAAVLASGHWSSGPEMHQRYSDTN
jgi:GTP-binding protein EngB required for normal cell division